MSEVFKNIISMARRFKLATALNVIGLIVGFATLYLLMTQILFHLNYNHGVKDYQRMYRIETNYVYKEVGFSEHVCRPIADALQHLAPMVESYSLVRIDQEATFPFLKGNKEIDYAFNEGNNTAVSAVTDEALDGSIEWTDDDQSGIIIPASIALDYFGSTNVAGKDMILVYGIPGDTTEQYPLTVRGVYADFPDNSEFANCIYSNMGDEDILQVNYLYRCDVKFKTRLEDPEAIAEQLKLAIIDDFNKSIADETARENILEEMKNLKIRFTPLEESYFETNSTGTRGYKGMLYILELASLLVILIVAINFLNFTLLESPMRIRGLNTRLVLGASRRSLRLGLCAECIITSIVSCLIALLLCHSLSLLQESRILLDGTIGLHSHPTLVWATLGVAVIVGIVAGIYPAVFATSFPLAMALKGSYGLTPAGLKLRTILMSVQLFVSMLMITYLGILLLQRNYIFTSSYGYDKNQVFFTQIDGTSEVKDQLKQDLLNVPGVENVSYSSVPLGTTDFHYLIKTKKNKQHFDYNFLWSDDRFLSTLGIELTEGRDFKPGDTAVVIINEEANKQWKWISLGNKISTNLEDVEGDSAMVIGVFKDIRYGTLRVNNNQPYCFVIKDNDYFNVVNVRFSPGESLQNARRQADKLIREYCGIHVKPLSAYDKELERVYRNELRFFNLVSIISFICMIITLIGMFCMTMFETEYRRKEIGIRKVAGATTREIVWMLCKRYSWLVLICFVAAMPFAYLFGKMTLDYFAEHTPIHWWIFVLALLLVGSITLATIAFQSWRAGRENPVNSIKTE